MIKIEKGPKQKVNLGWPKDRKENPINALSTHIGALVGANSLSPRLSSF
jgi:hypothetical protein